MKKINKDYCCPIDGSNLSIRTKKKIKFKKFEYPIVSGIPCLYFDKNEDKILRNKTINVKKFYTKYPFPNYNDFDDIQLFVKKTKENHFSKLLSQQIGENKKILEIGCGTGQLTNYLAATTFSQKIYGTDISLNSLKLANNFKLKNNLKNIDFCQMNLFEPCFKKNSMDLVISNGVLHHTYDPEQAFYKIAELVKPGGYIIIALYNYLGRIITVMNKFLYQLFGLKGLFLDKYLKSGISLDKKNSWVQDQYNHPLESLHSMGEVLDWFKKKKISFISSIPKIIGEFSNDEKLFKQQNRGDVIDRFNIQFEMILNYQYKEGGLFMMIGKRNKTKV